MKNAYSPNKKGFRPWKGWQKEKDAKRKMCGKLKVRQEARRNER